MTEKDNTNSLSTEKNEKFNSLIYKFLDYSSRSTFYNIAALGLFFSAIYFATLLAPEDAFDENTLQQLFLTGSAVLVGLLWWRGVINKSNMKKAVRDLADFFENDDLETKRKKVFDALKKHRNTGIEKIRRLRLFSIIVAAAYLLFLAIDCATMYNSGKTDYFNPDNLFKAGVVGVSVLISVITTVIINSKFNKKFPDKITEQEN